MEISILKTGDYKIKCKYNPELCSLKDFLGLPSALPQTQPTGVR